MDPEEGGGFLQARIMGIPAWIILAGAAVLAYLYFSHQSSAASANRPTTTGGGGKVSTGKTVVQSGAVSINVGSGEDNDLSVPGNHHQPKPPIEYKGPVKAITVTKDENFSDLAGSRNWSEETIGDVENLTQPKGPFKGKKLRADTQLHKGDVIYRPIGRGKAEQGI